MHVLPEMVHVHVLPEMVHVLRMMNLMATKNPAAVAGLLCDWLVSLFSTIKHVVAFYEMTLICSLRPF